MIKTKYYAAILEGFSRVIPAPAPDTEQQLDATTPMKKFTVIAQCLCNCNETRFLHVFASSVRGVKAAANREVLCPDIKLLFVMKGHHRTIPVPGEIA